MYIYLETNTDVSKIIVFSDRLVELGRIEREMKSNLTDELLPQLDRLIHADKGEIHGLFVNTSPGSYTAVRISITVANFLGYAFNFQPIGVGTIEEIQSKKSKKFRRPLLPTYASKPFITKKEA